MLKVGKNIDFAVENIKEGNLVVFPTETVYGLGAYALNEKSVEKIFKAKNRPADNPLIVHVSSVEMVEKVAKNIGEIEKKIIEKFWPGPISIILEKKENVPSNVTAGLNTVSVRMPDNKYALELISKTGPIAAPSANISGKPSGTCIEDIYDELENEVAYFIDDGYSNVGIESTVVKVENNVIKILRPGKITKEDLEEICDVVEVDKNCFESPKNDEKVLSPGMKHRHYAPKAECFMINFLEEEKLLAYISKIVAENENKKIGFMFENRVFQKIDIRENVKKYDLGENLEEVSKNIFNYLRKVDKDNLDVCYIQGFKKEGLGLGIMNRLIRACEYNVIDIM